ncbi:hypothetical protein OHA79_09880 [Streptomyces sp. NBC_00841]|uniref:hypothetical protein n=1 Tax=unclassified Streptomyces TaxID=2593676 RepID=UPI0022531C6D|nr:MULTISPECIES: hypothetical protein [unclassified Streptomyces]MCX4536666.1 hypothetical protein [Streptomyces sp. NBC_01669]WRZ98113.1 hypothetical protein OHA79_09880 [Streptomyces sp. NBC_00841]
MAVQGDLSDAALPVLECGDDVRRRGVGSGSGPGGWFGSAHDDPRSDRERGGQECTGQQVRSQDQMS